MAEHEGLVGWVLRRQWRGSLSFGDALHEGRLGLWAAVRGYDPGRGTAFSTYAVPAIQRAIWRAVKASSHPVVWGDENENQSLPVSSVAYPDDPVELICTAEVRAELHRLVGQLPWALQQVIVAHYGLDGKPSQTFASIGQWLGVTRQRAQQLHVSALLWLGHPSHSLGLRTLLERQTRSDYQQALARQREWARTRRGQRRVAK